MKMDREKQEREVRWISATVNETYSNDPKEGLKEIEEGDQVILEVDNNGNQTWRKT